MLKCDIERFFENYKSILDTCKFSPKFIWNLDETMLNIGELREKTAAKKGSVIPVVEKPRLAEHVTLLLCVSAFGGWLKPLAIFPLKTVPPFAEEVYEAFYMAGQDSGWIDGRIFKNYIEKIFVKAIDDLRVKEGKMDELALLLLDHHSSRDSIDVKMLWETHKIIIHFLPPHSSAIMQPLDLSVNGEFKENFRTRCVFIKNESAQERRNRILQIADRALSRVNNRDTILTGFERTGLWPYQPEVALCSNMLVDTVSPLPALEPGKRRKRRKNMSGGGIFENGTNIVLSPDTVNLQFATVSTEPH